MNMSHEIHAAVQLAHFLGAEEGVQLGGSAEKTELRAAFTASGIHLADVDANPITDAWPTSPVGLLVVSVIHPALPRAKEPFLDSIRAALKKLPARSLIVIDSCEHDPRHRAGIIVREATQQGYWLVVAGPQAILLPAELRPDEIPPLSAPRFDQLKFDDAIALQRQGMLWQAQNVYERILRETPGHVCRATTTFPGPRQLEIPVGWWGLGGGQAASGIRE
jgi:hypothetical protein